VDDLPTWVRWIIVVGVGLSPILTCWTAIALVRFLRRKLRSRAQRGAAVVADRPGPVDPILDPDAPGAEEIRGDESSPAAPQR
jgi:hypothetical protein